MSKNNISRQSSYTRTRKISRVRLFIYIKKYDNTILIFNYFYNFTCEYYLGLIKFNLPIANIIIQERNFVFSLTLIIEFNV